MFTENVLERYELMKLRTLRRSAKLSAPGLTIIILHVGVVSNLVLSSLEVPIAVQVSYSLLFSFYNNSNKNKSISSYSS